MDIADLFEGGHLAEVSTTAGVLTVRRWDVELRDDPVEFDPYFRIFAAAKMWAQQNGGHLRVQYEDPDRLAIYGTAEVQPPVPEDQLMNTRAEERWSNT